MDYPRCYRAMNRVSRTLLTSLAALPVLAAVGISACGSDESSPPPTGDAGSDAPSIIEDPRPDPALSTISADPATVVADGTSTTKLTVTLKQSSGRLIDQPTPVVLTSSGKGDTLTPEGGSGLTDGRGIFTATMSSTSAETKTVTATFVGRSINTQVNFQLCHGSLFRPPAPYAVGAIPSSIATGDFNADKRLDLAVTNVDDRTVSILLGSSNGTFSAATNYNVGAEPQSVVTGDFNGDAKPDLAVANGPDTNLSILLGNGNGTFSAATNYGVDGEPQSVETGDFNRDGKLDLAVVAGDVSILLGNGNGTFSGATNYPVGASPNFVKTGDFNADGKLDLAVSNGVDNNVSILLGNGNGTFSGATNYPVGGSPGSVALGDFNADAKLDLTVGTDKGVSTLLGNGSGTFSPATEYTAGVVGARYVVTGDFNKDSKLDWAVANYSSNNVDVRLGDGKGSFSFGGSYSVDSPSSSRRATSTVTVSSIWQLQTPETKG